MRIRTNKFLISRRGINVKSGRKQDCAISGQADMSGRIDLDRIQYSGTKVTGNAVVKHCYLSNKSFEPLYK